MSLDPSVFEHNRSQLARLQQLIAQLTDADLNRSVGDDWTVAVVLAHLAFWDQRALNA